MKKALLWILALIITLSAAVYQRKTGPTYPVNATVTLNRKPYVLKLTRSIGLDERSEIKLAISDTSVKAVVWFRRFKTDDKYDSASFKYKTYHVHSFVMNKVFHMYEEKGLFAGVPPQPAAGKLEYYIVLTDSSGSRTLFKEKPVVIRFKGGVPAYILAPHILLMFLAMFFSTAAGLLAIAKIPSYRKYALLTFYLLVAGGAILGPLVQRFAFGELWTGIPFGWDLTDNKTLIALVFWIIAVAVNRRKERPLYTIIASIILLLVFSIPHSAFGSELNYATGQVTQGIILIFFIKKKKIL